MKKPFLKSGIGKLLTHPVVKGLIKTIPFGVGSMAGNVLDETQNSQPGAVDWPTVMPQLIKIVIYGVLAYYALSGAITFEDAENAQDLIGN